MPVSRDSWLLLPSVTHDTIYMYICYLSQKLLFNGLHYFIVYQTKTEIRSDPDYNDNIISKISAVMTKCVGNLNNLETYSRDTAVCG
jgi:hypothetical protein